MDALRLDLRTVLSDPLLARGRLLTRDPGLPVVYGGNFALTFIVEADGHRFALRCFHKPSADLRERYEAISSHLKGNSSPYFVDFEFQPSGIRTESGVYPVVRMDWADGPTLDAFVAENRQDASAMQELRESLRRLAANLAVCGIAHGDIQPSNIIANAADRLKLIDYDGMFVPELDTRASAEVGQRNFQHPGRRAWHFDRHLDEFSFAVLDLALDALAKSPDLWEATGSGEDAIIFREQDYQDPAQSAAFRAVANIPRLQQRTRNLAAICLSPFERIPTFSDFLVGRNIPEVQVAFSGAPTVAKRRTYRSPHAVVDAANFARCCSHVGDRVELVGKITRVARSHTPRFESSYLRVEFGQRGHDMACLRIWPEAESRLVDVPNPSWAGQWISSVGLLEPVARSHSGYQRQRDISMSISERTQLQRITEPEARRRLAGRDELARRPPDAAQGVRTDPVLTDRASPFRADVTRRPHGGTRPAPPRTRRAGHPPPDAPGAPDIQPPPAAPAEASSAATVAVALVQDSPARPPVGPERAESPTRPASVPALTLRHGLGTSSRRREQAGASAPVGRQKQLVAWAALVAFAVAGLILTIWALDDRPSIQPLPDPPSSERPVDLAVSTPATSEYPPSAGQVPVRLEREAPLRGAPLPVSTVAGPLGIGADLGEPGTHALKQIVTIDAQPLKAPRDDRIILVHRAVYSDRDVVVGFSECVGPRLPCGVRRPFWLVLRASQPPVVHEAPGLWAGSTGGNVTALQKGVRVELGVWNGERRTVTLRHDGTIEASRQRAAIAPLNRSECALVANSLEACATSANCASFASSARPIPRQTRSGLERIYHEKTGLDAVAYRSLCARSCQLGLTPSAAFVRRYACSAARPDQWVEHDPAAGLFPE